MALLNWTRKPSTRVSDNQLAAIVDSLNDVVMMLDNHHHIQMLNRCWETITGIPVREALNRPFSDFLHPEDIPNWSKLLQSMGPESNELIWFRLICDTGELRWCEMRIQQMNADVTSPLSATICDITPQVRNDQVTHANHRSLQSLVDRLPAMLYRARNNISWTMEYVSQGCELVTGYSAEQLLNQSQISLGSIIHPDDASYVWENVQIGLQAQTTFDLKYRLTKADGSEIIVQDTARGLYSESGMVLGIEGIILQCI